MPSPRQFTADLSTVCRPRRKRGRPAKPAKKQCAPTGAAVSQDTKDRLLSEAVACFGASVEPDVLKAWIEETLQQFLSRYPFWFGRTPSADSASRAKRRRYLIERGLIQPNAVPAGFLAKKRQWAELTLEEGPAANNTLREEEGHVV